MESVHPNVRSNVHHHHPGFDEAPKNPCGARLQHATECVVRGQSPLSAGNANDEAIDFRDQNTVPGRKDWRMGMTPEFSKFERHPVVRIGRQFLKGVQVRKQLLVIGLNPFETTAIMVRSSPNYGLFSRKVGVVRSEPSDDVHALFDSRRDSGCRSLNARKKYAHVVQLLKQLRLAVLNQCQAMTTLIDENLNLSLFPPEIRLP
jgi:hypothetical protein